MDVGVQAVEVLNAAADVLHGSVVRTSASVIGRRASESLIVATTSWGFTVSALMSDLRVGFTVRPRGWLRKALVVEGGPVALVNDILDPTHFERVAAFAPLLIELGPTALRLEQRYGADVLAGIELVTALARRIRLVDGLATRQQLAG